MRLKDLIAADVATVFLNTDDFAQVVTLSRASGGNGAMTVNQCLFLLGRPPLPDGADSVYDRMHRLGVFRIGEASDNSPLETTVTAIVELDIEDEEQGSTIDDNFGRRIVRMGRLHVAADVAITVAAPKQLCDRVTIDGEEWQILRIEGRDENMATYVIRREDKTTTKQGKQRQ